MRILASALVAALQLDITPLLVQRAAAPTRILGVQTVRGHTIAVNQSWPRVILFPILEVGAQPSADRLHTTERRLATLASPLDAVSDALTILQSYQALKDSCINLPSMS